MARCLFQGVTEGGDEARPNVVSRSRPQFLSACLSNDDISNSIRAIAAINPPSTTGGSLLGLAGNSSGAAGDTAGSPAARPAPAAVILRYRLDHLRNDQMLTPSSLARLFVVTPPPPDTRNIPEHGILESAY